MKPRTIHLLILCVLCVVPAGLGAALAVKASNSHSDFSGLDVAIGLGAIAASGLYAAISSLLVWKLAPTPRRVFAVHGGIFCAVAAFYGLPRLYTLVAR